MQVNINTIEKIKSDYDTEPYTSFPFAKSYPVHLAALATLFGLQAPAVSGARILELGCASGGNSIPLAIRYPDCSVTGIDLSSVQIKAGQAVVEALGLKNVRLVQGDLTRLNARQLKADAQYDYIICHGVYSWVPPEVQDAILRICHEHLTPTGIAYLSYNTYPGWKAKEVIRDAMQLRSQQPAAHANRLGFARGMIDFLEEVALEGSLLQRIVKEHGPLVHNSQDYYVKHEYLEECNAPVYFLKFLERAHAHGLSYLAEASQGTMFASNYPDSIAHPLLRESGGDQILLEQYLDFVTNRTFRQTLLVHADRASSIQYRLRPESVRVLHYAALLQPPGAVKSVVFDASAVTYATALGATVTLSSAAAKAGAQALSQAWPETLDVPTLVARSAHLLAEQGVSVDGLETALLELLEFLLIHDLLHMSTMPVRRSEQVGSLSLPPVWRRYAQATGTQGVAHVTGIWHEPIILNPIEQGVMPFLTDDLDPEALEEVVMGLVREGGLTFTVNGEPVQELVMLQASVREHVRALTQSFKHRFAV